MNRSRISKKRIAFAAFVTGLEDAAWEDAAAVLAHGIHEAGHRSRHDIEAVVLAPENFPASRERSLLDLGFDRVIKRPLPVRPVPRDSARVRLRWVDRGLSPQGPALVKGRAR